MARVVQLRVGALPCPLPIVRLAECARELDAGDLVHLTGSDPAIGPDVDVWCMRFGHRVLSADRSPGGWSIRVQLTSRGRDWVPGTPGGQESNTAG
ncbi:MAG TPA: sulfurtransferase TusA family protein [Myxococcaceae bacterium]|nr:sulfurtransferase TusA family protein [Myxococcaceae bacterium]